MTRVVLDSSAVLAMLWAEPGASLVSDSAATAMISSVNIAEIVARFLHRNFSLEETSIVVGDLKPEIMPFDEAQAILSGMLRPKTQHRGLSLGDRACLALAMREKATVLTADRAWSDLDLGVEIKIIR